MKRSLLLRLVLGLLLFVGLLSSCTQKETFEGSESLPKTALSFIEQHFPGSEVSYVNRTKEYISSIAGAYHYEANLSTGVRLVFDKEGAWEQIDCISKAIPQGILPASIYEEVAKRYAGKHIVKAKRTGSSHTVWVSNGKELSFNQYNGLVEIK